MILVSHNLEHVFEVADTIFVLRNGRRVACVPKDSVSRRDVVGLITGAITETVA